MGWKREPLPNTTVVTVGKSHSQSARASSWCPLSHKGLFLATGLPCRCPESAPVPTMPL